MGLMSTTSKFEPDYDRKAELKSFDETKTGVKGLVDSGITHIPRIFHRPPSPENTIIEPSHSIPNLATIDMQGIDKDLIKRKEVIKNIKDAFESWGMFQIVNHGISNTILDEIINGVKRFHDQDTDVKKHWYIRDNSVEQRRVVYNSSFDLYTAPVANWRDTFIVTMAPNPPQPHELPPICRDILIEYSKQVLKLGERVLQLVSEGLGLDVDHLTKMGCAEGVLLVGHYYPPCPQPELAIGTPNHKDHGFITILLQDHIGGLQVFFQNQWIDVPPIPGALVVNAGDLLQLITNGKFVSAKHKVVAKNIGPRISVASSFSTGLLPSSKVFEPIKELLSEDNGAKYRCATAKELMCHYRGKGPDGKFALSLYEI
ncbi:1-aminocyclopropane-1-carboxylate oxidase homolog 1-like [Rutidosis leptorrhynchoides]|uniref:1-aminocyclopropane-1-carboxylate oxidase homolog 1-like n=1 Tax=Rutidosis leptorrhynchoides TaxID=125765 RepID=UPI003A9A551D